jgi:hypothetical protein
MDRKTLSMARSVGGFKFKWIKEVPLRDNKSLEKSLAWKDG